MGRARPEADTFLISSSGRKCDRDLGLTRVQAAKPAQGAPARGALWKDGGSRGQGAKGGQGQEQEQGSCSGKQQPGLAGFWLERVWPGWTLEWLTSCSDSGLAEHSELSAGMRATQVLRTSQTARTGLICYE